MMKLFCVGAVLAALAAQVPAPQPPGETKPAKPVREPGLYAVIMTSMGDITARLFEKESPITVQNFVALATGRKEWTDPKTGQILRRPLYSGTAFHRAIPGFMIQGGDPSGTGTGNAGLTPIPDEFHPTLKFDIPGRLAMANSGPNTGTCQFFITEVPTPHLNGRHTIFGQVVEGQELVGEIARVPRDENNRPHKPVVIRRIVIKREPPVPVKKTAPAKP
jgi:peptidyl-prolyl cis-trans isomerase A (cyclophilin A)